MSFSTRRRGSPRSGVLRAHLLLRAGLAAQALPDPGRPGVLQLCSGRPVVPGELVDVLVPDLIAATKLHQTLLGPAQILLDRGHSTAARPTTRRFRVPHCTFHDFRCAPADPAMQNMRLVSRAKWDVSGSRLRAPGEPSQGRLPGNGEGGLGLRSTKERATLLDAPPGYTVPCKVARGYGCFSRFEVGR
jgi:hypothetical protein